MMRIQYDNYIAAHMDDPSFVNAFQYEVNQALQADYVDGCIQRRFETMYGMVVITAMNDIMYVELEQYKN